MEPRTRHNQTSNRERILQNAADLFYRVGYPGTSVDDILAACGVAKSNFYYHFKSKEDLACAVLDRRYEAYENLMRCSLIDMKLPPSRRIAKFFEAIYEMQAGPEQMAGCLFGNFAAGLATDDNEQNERFRIRLCQFFRRTEGYLHACLLEGVASGAFRNDIPPLELAHHLMATLQGLMALAKTYRDAEMLRTGFETAQRMLQKI